MTRPLDELKDLDSLVDNSYPPDPRDVTSDNLLDEGPRTDFIRDERRMLK